MMLRANVQVSCVLLLLLLLLMLTGMSSSGSVRRYYLVARDVSWDYAPTGMNQADLSDQDSADVFLKRSSNRIGREYKKTAYFQYTDKTFTVEIPKRPVLGILGPVLHAEVGDRLEITYFNNASRRFSVHPHGLFYLKHGEGALYLDGTSGKDKQDEIVPPGETATLTWNVTENDAPAESDPNCLPWLYHSHVDTPRDTSVGLTGILVTCKAGVLDENNRRKDMDEEIPIFVKNYDENMSWHLADNIAAYCPDPDLCSSLAEDGDEDFTESNYMRSINGYMFGHLPGLEACVGHKVAIYIIGFGNEFDVHSIHFHGQTLKYQQTKGDTVSVYSATFVDAVMTPSEAGRWRVTDLVGRNQLDGISAFLETKSCPGVDAPQTQYSGKTLNYFLSAEEVTWDYGPGGTDLLTGRSLTAEGSHSEAYHGGSSGAKAGMYTKARFVQYTDSTFSQKRPMDGQHTGLLGPVLRAEVGDTVKVTLQNRLEQPVSLRAHGFTYSAQQEDEVVAGVDKSSVGTYREKTYTFRVPDDFLSEVTEPCLNFLYTSAASPNVDYNMGLVGPVLICKKDQPKPKPKEFFLLLGTFDENLSPLLKSEDAEEEDLNLRFSINGYSFGTIPGLEVCQGDTVVWYVMSMGSDLDVHTVTFDGNPYSEKGTHRDARQLVPGSTAALRMVANNPGVWEIMSHSTVAREGGMYGSYKVKVDGCAQANSTASGDEGAVTREYFVAAEEVNWNYAPLERSVFTGKDLNNPEEDGHIFILDNDEFIGPVYKKAVFRGYTDGTFKTRLPVLHENILGPALRAEVGDLIKVNFWNKASRTYSMHSRGIKTSQEESGTNYGRASGARPGQTRVYHWQVPESAGPGPADPNCLPWVYYSAVDPTRDVNSGLVGTVLVCRPGTLDSSGQRTDVDKELFLLMSVLNENLSWYLQENVRTYAPARLGTDYLSDGDFEESNLMHAVNGRLFGNNPGLYMEYGTKVTWYLMSMGAEVDLHTFHLHGHTFIHSSESHREDVMQLFPGQAEAVEMIADNPGTWLLHCHVLDHIQAGMVTTYTVLDKGVKAPTDGSSPNIHHGDLKMETTTASPGKAAPSIFQRDVLIFQYAVLMLLGYLANRGALLF